MSNNTISKEEYLSKIIDKEKALKYALDIRKFEIELYWKRATYFWTFLAAALAAYILIVTRKSGADYINYTLIISGVSTVFSLSWWKVNEGSKVWQNNWEKQVDLLETEIIGPLYKSMITNLDNKKNFYSVSKINIALSKYFFFLWISLFIFHTFELFVSKNTLSSLIIIGTFLFIILTIYHCKEVYHSLNSSYHRKDNMNKHNRHKIQIRDINKEFGDAEQINSTRKLKRQIRHQSYTFFSAKRKRRYLK